MPKDVRFASKADMPFTMAMPSAFGPTTDMIGSCEEQDYEATTHSSSG